MTDTVYVTRKEARLTAPSRFAAKTEAEKSLKAIDFSRRLASGVSISSVTWTSIPTGLTLSSQTNTSTTAQCLISSGAVGQDYIVSCQVVTDETPAQTFEARPMLKVIQGVDV